MMCSSSFSCSGYKTMQDCGSQPETLNSDAEMPLYREAISLVKQLQGATRFRLQGVGCCQACFRRPCTLVEVDKPIMLMHS